MADYTIDDVAKMGEGKYYTLSDVAAMESRGNKLEAAKMAAQDMPAFDRFVAAYGGAVPSLVRGVRQAFTTNPSELARLKGEEDDARIRREALGTAGVWGHGVGSVAAATPTMMIPGANTIPGAMALGAVQGASEPLVDGESRLLRAGLGFGLGGAAQWAIPKAAMALGQRSFNNTALQTANLSKDTAQSEGRKLGLSVAPSEAGGGRFNDWVESLAGKAALKQDIQRKNADVIRTQIAPRSVGASEPLTPDILATLRKKQGQAGYAPLDSMGAVNWTPEYVDALKAVESRYGRAKALTSSQKVPEVGQLVDELNVGQMSGKQLNETIKDLRELGNKNAAIMYGQNPSLKQLGKAQISASTALEDLATQNLATQGKQDLIPALRQSRAEIAKTYDLERALNPVTGDVSPSIFAKKIRKGEKLTGDLKTLGEMAAAFPNAFAADAARIPSPGVSALNIPTAIAAGAAGVAGGGTSGAIFGGIPFLRAPARAIITSKPYQSMVAQPSYGGHGLLGVTPGMMDSETARLLGRLLAAQGGLLATGE
jgi:hypothetical protein